jgi:hypothetical protein
VTRAAFDALHADPWAQDQLDLPALNAHASQAIEDAIEHVRRAARSEARALRSSSLAIVGPPGSGKTHLFARLRRKLGPRAVFVSIRPPVITEMSPRFVLGEVVRQLAFAPARGLPQANALVGSFLGRLDGIGATYPSAVLSEYAALQPDERAERLETAIEGMLALCPELDEPYLARLLEVPFAPNATARALLAWLSGSECDDAQLERIGASASLSEARGLPALRTLAAVGALGAPLVLVFDQLESLIEASGGRRLCAYANVTAELVDVLRGTVLVHMGLDTDWELRIEPSLNPAQRSRIVMRREQLVAPAAADCEALLRLLHGRLLTPRGPFPWPLGAERCERLCGTPGQTPRQLLAAFKAALETPSEPRASVPDVDAGATGAADPGAAAQRAAGEVRSDASPSETRVASVLLPPPRTRTEGSAEGSSPALEAPKSAPRSAPPRRDIASDWLARLRGCRETVRAARDERLPLHAAQLAEGVLALGRFVPGLALRATAKPPAQLALGVGEEAERVAIVQESNLRSLAAVLARLIRATQQARVVVLRGARELPESWAEPRARRAALLASGRARWIDLEPEDCARLLALASFLQAARSGDISDSRGQRVSEAEVGEWIESTLDVESWPLARALATPARVDEPVEQPSRPDDADEYVAPESFIKELGGALPVRRLLLDRAATALPALQRLRVASFERLVREVLLVDPEATRASVLAELDAAGDNVRWLGRSIVFLRENE